MANARLRVAYADDEPIALHGLERLLRGEADVDVLPECSNGVDVLQLIRTHRPDVALLDVSMPGMSGIDVVRSLATDERPAIVFVTAFDRFALDAFDVHAVDYLLKPFDEARFRMAFDRVRQRLRSGNDRDAAGRIAGLLEALSTRSASARLAVKDGDAVVLIPTNDIAWCEAEDNYVRIHAAGRRYLIRITMQDLATRLDSVQFARIHRSCIVNLSRVRELRPAPSGDYRVVLSDGTSLTMSRSYRESVLARLQPR